MSIKKPATTIPGTTLPRSWKHLNKADYLLISVFILISCWFLWSFFSYSQRSWSFDRLLPYLFYSDKNNTFQLGMLTKGFFTTVRLGIWIFILSLLVGGFIGIFTANRKGLIILPFTLFVQILRNIPPLVFLFLIYFFSGSFLSNLLMNFEGLLYNSPEIFQSVFSLVFSPPGQIEAMVAVVLALGIYEGVYIAEIVRSSIESIPKTQREAAASLGFNKFQSLYYIILPQTMRILLPPLAGQTVSIFKDTALAALVSLPELTFQSLEIMAVTRITFEVWLICMALYFFISRFCTTFYGFLENRIKWR